MSAFCLATLNSDVQRLTAFATAADLYDACDRGYLPTLRASELETSADAAARERLQAWLVHAGFRVFTGEHTLSCQRPCCARPA